MFGAKKRLKRMVENSFGKNPLEGYTYYNAEKRLHDVERFHRGIREFDTQPWEVDDITWDDLEMDQVFLRVNHTNSFIGEQVLYHRMHILELGNDLEMAGKLEERLAYLDRQPNLRTEMEMELRRIGKQEAGYYLAEFLWNTDLWKVGNSLLYHLLQVLLAVCLAAGIVFDQVIFLAGAVCVALVNLTLYLKVKQEYEIIFTSLIEFKKVYDFAGWIEKKDREEFIVSKEVKTSIHRLQKMSWGIMGMNGRRQASMTGEVMAILREYLWGILLIDVSMFNHMMKILSDKQKEVLELLNFVGQIDSEIAILSYRKSAPGWCTPEFVTKGIKVEGIAHPLIPDSVTNDFELKDRAMITGSNASGKSTFMKSIAINGILAQSIHTCTAKKMLLQPMMIITCMSLRDDVLTGESYYYREAKYLKRMLELITGEKAVLAVIDEILKGTNTTERVAASKAILEYIGQADCLTLVATHDNELTENNLYENYHFCSIIQENDIVFDYRIHQGKSKSSNAIALLSYLEYPDRIVETAKRYLNENR